jgi:hypothetical protein
VPKVIVCDSCVTVKLCVTGVAATYFVFPGWLAVIEQVPAETRVTVLPETVQTGAVVDAKETVSPELAVALTVNGLVPNATLPSDPKLIVCDVVPQLYCATDASSEASPLYSACIWSPTAPIS